MVRDQSAHTLHHTHTSPPPAHSTGEEPTPSLAQHNTAIQRTLSMLITRVSFNDCTANDVN